MKLSLIRHLLSSSLLLVSSSIFAATINISDNLEIKEVNDKPFNQGFFSNSKTVEVKSGEHVLVIRYKDVFEDFDLGQDRVVESDYFAVRFILNKEQHLILKTSKVKGLSSAEQFVKSPEVMLINDNNQQLELELQTYEDYKLARQVNTVLTSLPQDKGQVNKTIQDQPAAVMNIEESDVAANGEGQIDETQLKQEFNEKVMSKVDTLPMLKYWWQRASADEKKSFMQFISTK